MHRDLAVGAVDPVDVGIGDQVEPLAVDLGEPGTDRLVLVTEEPGTAVDHGHVAAQCVEHVGQLRGDVAPADDDQALGQLGQPHDGVGGLERHGVQARDLGNRRSCAGREHDLAAPVVDAVDLDGPVGDEAGVTADDGDVVLAVAVRLARGGDGVDAAEHPVDDVGPADAGDLRVDAEALEATGLEGEVGGVDQHLGGDASPVHAGAAEQVAFDDADRPVVELGRQDRVAGARADDQQVELGG